MNREVGLSTNLDRVAWDSFLSALSHVKFPSVLIALQIEPLSFVFLHTSGLTPTFFFTAMAHILVDPNIAQCPDYLLDIYHAVWVPFVTAELTHQQAAVIFTTVWEAQNTVEKQQWQQQVDRDEEEAKEKRDAAEETEQL